VSKLKPATPEQRLEVQRAVYCLQVAREKLKRAGCNQSLIRVRSAIKSAEGALRHIDRRVRHFQTEGSTNV
jgi:hypothetical protein